MWAGWILTCKMHCLQALQGTPRVAHIYSRGKDNLINTDPRTPDTLVSNGVQKNECERCLDQGSNCPLRDALNSYPCHTCEDGGFVCDPIVLPQHGRPTPSEKFKIDGIDCLYPEPDAYGRNREYCEKSETICITGSAVDGGNGKGNTENTDPGILKIQNLLLSSRSTNHCFRSGIRPVWISRRGTK